jgi:hypothetical protein
VDERSDAGVAAVAVIRVVRRFFVVSTGNDRAAVDCSAFDAGIICIGRGSIEALRGDEAIAEADPLLLTVPNTLGVEYNPHVIESILTHVARALGWR